MLDEDNDDDFEGYLMKVRERNLGHNNIKNQSENYEI